MNGMRFFLLSIAVSVFALAGVEAHGASLADFAGTWKGQRYESANGVRYVFNQTTSFRYSNGGLVVKTQIRSRGLNFSGSGIYASDGSYSALLLYQGRPIAVGSGTWKLLGKTIRVKAVTNTGAGVVRSTASLQLVNPHRLVSVGGSAQAGTVSLTLKRVR